MSTKLLLPNQFKQIGWFLLIPATMLGIIIIFNIYEASWFNAKVFAIMDAEVFGKTEYMHVIKTNLTTTLIGTLFIIGALFVGFSKEKREDEFIAELRLSSLLWAVWVNYMLLFIAFAFVYGTVFFNVMIWNMFTVLIIFIVRFNYMLYKNSKSMSDEK